MKKQMTILKKHQSQPVKMLSKCFKCCSLNTKILLEKLFKKTLEKVAF